MELKYLIDTNIIIDNFGNKLPQTAQSFLNDLGITLSIVSKIEILGWRNATKSQLKPLYSFINQSTIIQLDEHIIDTTIQLRQNYSIKLGDAIIAATSIANNYTLLTHNTKDFVGINGLNVIDLYFL